jgi:hypothetical protein
MSDKTERYEVWQADLPRRPGEPPLDFPEAYSRVAMVETIGLDEAFLLTRHIDRPWQENPGVIGTDGARSTAPGDVIVDPSGQPHLVERGGFRAISNDPIPTPGEFRALAREIHGNDTHRPLFEKSVRYEDHPDAFREASRLGSNKSAERGPER